MNAGYSQEEINKVIEQCKKTGKSFMYREVDTENRTFANFLFIGENDGTPVIFDSFIYTLETEYFSTLYEEAQEEVIRQHPEWANANFEAEEGEHIDLLEAIADELSKDDQYDIQEFVDVDEDAEYGIMLDICLNVPEITDDIIEKFVKEFNSNTLELDETFYSFDLE